MSFKTKLRVGDTVKIIAGKDKGKVGNVLKIDRENNKVLVEGVNRVKKTIKPRNPQEKGGIIEKEAFIHCSNVMFLEDGIPRRLEYKFEKNENGDTIKVRVAKKHSSK